MKDRRTKEHQRPQGRNVINVEELQDCEGSSRSVLHTTSYTIPYNFIQQYTERDMYIEVRSPALFIRATQIVRAVVMSDG